MWKQGWILDRCETKVWGRSSIGRAPGLQPGGCRFDPGRLHLTSIARSSYALRPLRRRGRRDDVRPMKPPRPWLCRHAMSLDRCAVPGIRNPGTGEKLIASALHDLSSRRLRAFVRLNCAAIPLGLLRSTRAHQLDSVWRWLTLIESQLSSHRTGLPMKWGLANPGRRFGNTGLSQHQRIDLSKSLLR